MSKIFNRFGHPSGLSLVGAIALGAMSTSALAQEWKPVVLDPPGSLSPQTTGVWGNVQVGSAYYGPEGNAYTHALLWRGAAAPLVDLTPSFADSSGASGVFGDQQVGAITVNGVTHAGLWHGTAASFVDLDPAGGSGMSGTSGSQQVGRKGGHAVMWSGSAESMVDLHPAFALQTSTSGVGNGQQVGWVSFNNDSGHQFHACMWRGTAESFVDLHNDAWESSRTTGVSANFQVGSMFPRPFHGYSHAILSNGSAASWIDLTPPGRVSSEALGGTDGYQVGWVEDRAALWTGTAESWVDLSVYLPRGTSTRRRKASGPTVGLSRSSGTRIPSSSSPNMRSLAMRCCGPWTWWVHRAPPTSMATARSTSSTTTPLSCALKAHARRGAPRTSMAMAPWTSTTTTRLWSRLRRAVDL
mgnify:CR=1 FL=1